MSVRFVTLRVTDRLERADQDRAVFMQRLCDFIVDQAKSLGATGAVVDEVVWLDADSRQPEGATVVIRPEAGAGFAGVTAQACRDWLKAQQPQPEGTTP